MLVNAAGKPVRIDQSTAGLVTTNRNPVFFYDENLVDGVWSEVVLLPEQYDLRSISYDLSTTGTPSVQVTISPLELISAGTAIWREMPDNVRINPSITAIRARVTGDVGYFVVRAM
jgi:hypothetical protein